jgi:hypothetical protein
MVAPTTRFGFHVQNLGLQVWGRGRTWRGQRPALPVIGFVTGGSADAFADRGLASRKGTR